MNINALLADLDNHRRMVGENIGNVLSNPRQAIGNALSRYAYENLPTSLDVQDAQSVMPGMNNAMMGKVNNLAMSAMAPAATVFHGSPHVFDKFDMSKIGTGQGAQAYGHGLYVAENPAVAGDYRKTLTRSKSGTILVDGEPASGEKAWTAATLLSAGGDVDAVRRAMPRVATDMNDPKWQARLGALDELRGKDIRYEPAGATYRVDLPDEHIGKMLDWDKPLNEQPQIRDMWDKRFPGQTGWFDKDSKYTGRDLLAIQADRFGGDPERASNFLRSIGVPGVKYLDQGSRGASGTGKWRINYADGKSELFDFKPNDDVLRQMKATAKPEGTRNFVVFDDSLLKILGRE